MDTTFLASVPLYMAPRLAGETVVFVSGLGGRLSLWAMPAGGGFPRLLLPADVALMNPALVDGALHAPLPDGESVVVMLDRDGDEQYLPHRVPLAGGRPACLAPALAGCFTRLWLVADDHLVLSVEDPKVEGARLVRAPLDGGALVEVLRSAMELATIGGTADGRVLWVTETFTAGDGLLHRIEGDVRRRVWGTPLGEREGEGPVASFHHACALGGAALLVTTAFDEFGGLAWAEADGLVEVPVTGLRHAGTGELTELHDLELAAGGTRVVAHYNVRGVSWVYVLELDRSGASPRARVVEALAGPPPLAEGVVTAVDATREGVLLAFSSATDIPGLWRHVGGAATRLTPARAAGIDPAHLSAGEPAGFVSHDGLPVDARLYLPSPALGHSPPYPVVFYLHGGPQGQERPDFTWFSMPLVHQLNGAGIAVFAPNARGSTGYGRSFMKRVDKDWGGQDRLDHVFAHHHLRSDPRLDLDRAGVVGRSYGGYMTLTLAARHPELWAAAVDMFGPLDLLSFGERVPESWKPYLHLAVGHPEHDRALLVDRSPVTWLSQLRCPLLVVQGAQDPRVVRAESDDLVRALRNRGHPVEYLLFEDEGHDVAKTENRLRCYSETVRFFQKHLCAGATGG